MSISNLFEYSPKYSHLMNPYFNSLNIFNDLKVNKNVTINGLATFLDLVMIYNSINIALDYKINGHTVLNSDKIILNKGKNEIISNNIKNTYRLPKKSGTFALKKDIKKQYLNYGSPMNYKTRNELDILYPGTDQSFIPKNIYLIINTGAPTNYPWRFRNITLIDKTNKKIIFEKNNIDTNNIIKINKNFELPKKQAWLILKDLEQGSENNAIISLSCQFSSV